MGSLIKRIWDDPYDRHDLIVLVVAITIIVTCIGVVVAG